MRHPKKGVRPSVFVHFCPPVRRGESDNDLQPSLHTEQNYNLQKSLKCDR